ncbi:hypothetical protein AB0F73_12375 [Micromonospora purpureochromogenes]|uniref:hypothetical protein n=1 Tax=Micromonospora purpureochromogenes TaxID=47872 RepID=UPI003405BB37
MGWFSRRSRAAVPTPTKLDRKATREDLAALEEFVTSRQGVEFYLEPETTATDTTVVAIAHDGEWIRRRTGSPQVAAKLAGRHAVPLYEAAKTGYPERMRVWSRAHPERRMR